MPEPSLFLQALEDLAIETFSDINDLPEPPTAEKAGNGSHIIERHNSLLEFLGQYFVFVAPTYYPHVYVHWHEHSIIDNGNGLASQTPQQQFYNTAFLQFPAALGDVFSFEANLAAGWYTLEILGIGNADCGMLIYDLGEGTTVQLDFYSENLQYNWKVSQDIELKRDGNHTFRFAVDKRAASTGYGIPITRFVFKRHSSSPNITLPPQGA